MQVLFFFLMQLYYPGKELLVKAKYRIGTRNRQDSGRDQKIGIKKNLIGIDIPSFSPSVVLNIWESQAPTKHTLSVWEIVLMTRSSAQVIRLCNQETAESTFALYLWNTICVTYTIVFALPVHTNTHTCTHTHTHTHKHVHAHTQLAINHIQLSKLSSWPEVGMHAAPPGRGLGQNMCLTDSSSVHYSHSDFFFFHDCVEAGH